MTDKQFSILISAIKSAPPSTGWICFWLFLILLRLGDILGVLKEILAAAR
jgi:hypothetical protein